MTNPNYKFTPNIHTHVILDETRNFVQEPPFSHQRFSDEMLRGGTSENLQYQKGAGWMVADRVLSVRYIIEEETIVPVPSIVAPNFVSKKLKRKPTDTEFPGMGAAGSFVATSAPVYIKNLAAGTSWAQALFADQTAFPSPTQPTAHVPVDRVMKSNDNDTVDGTILLMFTTNGAITDFPDTVFIFYFNAIAGRTPRDTGTGQYSLTFMGNGTCVLHEKLTDGPWTMRKKFRWEGWHSGTNKSFFVYITKERRVGNQIYGKGQIQFTFTYASETFDDPSDFTIEHFTPALGTKPGGPSSAVTHIYSVPGITKYQPATTLSPLRLDLRRDLRYGFNLYKGDFAQTGTFKDAPFAITTPFINTNDKITLEWSRDLPTGTTVDLDLYDYTSGSPVLLTPVTTGPRLKTYTPTYNMRLLAVHGSMTGTATATPLLRSYRVIRDGHIQTITGDGIELHGILRIDIRGQDRDPSHETAKVVLTDPLQPAVLDKLDKRGSIPIRIECEYDPNDANKRVVLFSGFVERADAVRKGYGSGDRGLAGGTPNANGYPAQDRKEYTLTCSGEWLRLKESLTLVRQAFWDVSVDPNGPIKFSDLIRLLISYAGYPDTEIDVPDKEVRMFAGTESKHGIIEPASEIFKNIQEYVEIYTGDFLTYDRNAGSAGKWLVRTPPIAPYTNLAAFTPEPPGNYKVFSTISYPDAVTDANFTYETGAPTVPTIKGSFRSWVKRPEANYIQVSAMGSTWPIPNQVFARAINFESFDYHTAYPADPDHPDYIGRLIPMFVVFPVLHNFDNPEEAQSACDWCARRLYDIHATSRKRVSFESTLALVPHEDGDGKKRPLRYYDPVTYDGVQYLVTNVNIVYSHDHVQTVIYELEEPRM